AEFGWQFAPGATVEIMPCLAGFVGGDALCAAVACGLDTAEEPALLMDIGTNGEIVLGDKNGLWACSAAAGPAFEGACITHGMSALPGAICGVSWEDGGLKIKTLADKPPIGLCGSGLIDAVATLVEQEYIDETGYFEDMLLAGDVWLTAQDIRQVQLAKGAMAAGVEILLHEAKLKAKDIKHVYLAGGFGTWMNPVSACRIGLISPELLHKITPCGNAAGTGARQALLSKAHRARIETASIKASYVELSNHPLFQGLFMDNMMF
ncbi:MAG: ATP-binding protein, partial [Clostridia bacterium]|nr:ATP-binding protein [Clostridia bacterium]